MKYLKKIQLSEFQLERLLNDEEKSKYRFILDKGVFCTGCGDTCPKGIEVEKVWLNRLNDIHTDGRCSYCGHRVTRILEFGEDKSFYDKAMEFRMSLGN